MVITPLALVLLAVAVADEFNVLENAAGAPIWLLEPIPGHWTERTGFGTPSVVYDDQRRQFVMYFESRIYDEWLFNEPDDTPAGLGLDPRSYDDCRLGRDPANPAIVWAIGRATSPDGFTWTVDPWPVLLPVPGTFAACQVAQPAAVYEKQEHWHLYYKAVQWNPNDSDPDRVEPCAAGPAPAWGCTRVTGFGYASSLNGRIFVDRRLVLPAADVTAATGVPADQIGFPRVSSLSLDWYLWYTAVPSVYQATSSKPGDPFTSGTAPLSEYPEARTGRLTTGTVFCRDAVPPAAMFDGQWGANSLVCGMSAIATNDLVEWTRGTTTPLLTWDCEAGWDRWDVLVMKEEHVLWYSAKEADDSTAPRRVGFAATIPLRTQPPYAALDLNAVQGKVCKKAPILATQLPGWTTQFEPVAATATAQAPEAGGGCGCGGGLPGGAVALPGVLVAMRRRAGPGRRGDPPTKGR